ncbi:MAG: hypothetical protein JSW50_11265 [Candidatus Latescibacterota bacterium]|nr:MAG: hypothetical protein JSW50_11265 [Candidatus Latescibacterota bacterium]
MRVKKVVYVRFTVRRWNGIASRIKDSHARGKRIAIAGIPDLETQNACVGVMPHWLNKKRRTGVDRRQMVITTQTPMGYCRQMVITTQKLMGCRRHWQQ